MSIRPYLAVIVDSFRAALSSRVLWVAIVMIWLFLMLLAPFGYREDFTTRFRWQDIHNGTRMKAMLARGLVSQDAEKTPEGNLANAMPEELKRKLELVGKGEDVRVQYSVLVDALNGLIEDEAWYDKEVWKSSLRLRELRELDEKEDGELSETLRKRRARLRVEAALPGVFNTRSDRSILLTYGGRDFPTTWNVVVDKARFEMLINQIILPILINWLLGFAFIFLGILVTSSIIPDMLQPGSLHLLLSKPISRPLLLISKFIGGCAFVFLCVCQLMIGLYLIAGLRLDIWNPRLLWCIPVSVLMFSVFYCVSVGAGLLWRTSILATSVTIVFGAICFFVGFIGGLFDNAVQQPKRITGIAVVGEYVFASNQGGGLVRYDAKQNRWTEVFDDGMMNADRTLAPIAIGDGHLVTARIRNGRFNPFGSGAPELLVLSRDDDWAPEPSLRLPTATTQISPSGKQHVVAMNTGELSLVDRSAILDAAGQEEQSDQASEAEDENNTKEGNATSWLSKLNNMIGSKMEGFDAILPSGVTLTSPRAVVVSRDGNRITIVSGGRVVRLQPGSGQTKTPYEKTAEYQLEGDRSKRPHLAVSGDIVMVARKEEPIVFLDAKSLELQKQIEFSESDFVTQLVGLSSKASGQGRFLVSSSDGSVRLLATGQTSGNSSDEESSVDWGPRLIRGDVDFVYYDEAAEKVYVVHDYDEIQVIGADDLRTVKSISPMREGWRWADQWIIDPLQTVIPQTGALGETTASLISGRSAIEIGQRNDQSEVYRYKFAKPILSCSIFILVMMTVNCLYFATRDF